MCRRSLRVANLPASPVWLVCLLSLICFVSLRCAADDIPPKATPEVQALLDAGFKLLNDRRPDEAEKIFQSALEKARAAKDGKGEADAIRRLGAVASVRGQTAQATSLSEQAIALYRQMGDRDGEGLALFNFGNIYSQTRKFDQALEYFRQALAIFHVVETRFMKPGC